MPADFRPFKVAIVGCGNIAKVHARILKKYIHIDNLAICDLDLLRLEEFAKASGIRNKFNSLDALLEGFKPQIVHIVTPPSSHTPIAVQCLKKNVNVLIEKPMCLTLDEARQIMAAEAGSKAKVCVDHMRSFDPMIKQALKILADENYGRIVNINMTYTYDYLQRIHFDPAARWIKNLPGGCFFDLLPHMLCLLNDFAPGSVLRSKLIRKNADGLVEDLWCLFESPSTTASVHLSLNITPLKNLIEFECEKGSLTVDLRNFILLERKNNGLPNAIERISGNMAVGSQYLGRTVGVVGKFLLNKLDPYAGLEYLTRTFMDAVAQDTPNPSGAKDARDVLKLTLDIFDGDAVPLVKEERKALAPADVLVTGGTGFIGKRLVKDLLEQGLKVRVFSHRHISADEAGALFGRPVEIVSGNIYSLEDVLCAVQGVRTIYHLAAAMKGDWNYHLDTTITGTKNILAAVKQNNIPQLVYVSTLNVYDAKHYPENRIINEDFAYEPAPEKRGAYSHAKLMAEKMVIAFRDQEKVNIAIVRPGLVYGPGGPKFPGDVGRLIGNRFIIVFGLGGRKIPFVHVDNLVSALTAIGRAPERSANGIFNVVDEDRVSQRKFISDYKKITRQGLIPLYVPLFFIASAFLFLEWTLLLAFRKKVFLNYKLDAIRKSPVHSMARLKAAVGWEQRIHFQEGIKELLQ